MYAATSEGIKISY